MNHSWKLDVKKNDDSSIKSSTENYDNILMLDLPTDILLHIFALCGQETWLVIAQVCHRFNAILGPNSFLWEQIAKQLLFVNNQSPIFQSKIHKNYLSAQLRFRVNRHWKKGVCAVKPIVSIREKHVLPWLVLKSEVIWIGTGSHIKAYPRVQPVAFNHKFKPLSGRVKQILDLTNSRGDIGRFVVKDDEDVVVAGDTNGSVLVWQASTGRLQFKETNCHSSDVASVDVFKNVIISGGRDKFVKVFRFENSNSISNRSKKQYAIEEIYLDDRILSIDIDPSGTLFCTGTAGHSGVAPSQLFDLATGVLICPLRKKFREGEGVYDVHFENPNELLTGDFNSALRLWDLRTQSNVLMWDDPHDSAVNCIATDNNMTILTGTAAHGGVRLWDKRQTRCVQLYFVKPELRSPVYSLDFDSSEMYAALDTLILGFDFSCTRKPTKDLVVYPC